MTQPMMCAAGEVAIRELAKRVEALEKATGPGWTICEGPMMSDKEISDELDRLRGLTAAEAADRAIAESDALRERLAASEAQCAHLQALLDDRGPAPSLSPEQSQRIESLLSRCDEIASEGRNGDDRWPDPEIAALWEQLAASEDKGRQLASALRDSRQDAAEELARKVELQAACERLLKERTEARAERDALRLDLAETAAERDALRAAGPPANGPETRRATLLRILDQPEGAWLRASEEHLLGAVAGMVDELRRTVDEQALELARLRVRMAGAER